MPRVVPAVLVTVVTALGLIVPVARVEAQRPQRVTLHTSDGVALAATFHEASHRPAPAVILVHMLTRTRRDLEPLAARLAAEGIATIAVDLRGHGESSVAPTDDGAGVAAMVQDVAAARTFLQARPDVQRERIGIAGASLGANLALALAAGDPSIRSLALLSPTLDYRGVRIEQAARKYAPRPMLLVASREDAYAWRTVRELTRGDAAVGRQTLLLDGAGHGTVMLARDSGLVRALLDWFHRTL